MRLVVNEITEEKKNLLNNFGFYSSEQFGHNGTWFKEYGICRNFCLVLNPVGNVKNSVAFGYSDDDLEDVEQIDAYYDMSEIYEDLQILIDAGIIERR